jgi:hypothetical protein
MSAERFAPRFEDCAYLAILVSSLGGHFQHRQ